jgi:hypothetical protein
MKPPKTSFGREPVALLGGKGADIAGEGIISGFKLRSTVVPSTPTAADRRKPGLERSTRYQRTGFTRASVREA